MFHCRKDRMVLKVTDKKKAQLIDSIEREKENMFYCLHPAVNKVSQSLLHRGDYYLIIAIHRGWSCIEARVFNDLIDDFTKSDFKSFWDDFEIFKITLKYGDLI
jgi:hypothetical protein